MSVRAVTALLTIAWLGCASTPDRATTPGRYAVPADVGALVSDDRAFAAFARELRADLVRGPALPDPLFVLALLDALDDDWDAAVARLDQIAAQEPDPDARLMRGLTIRIWADARVAGADTPDGFRAAMERRLADLPIDRLRDQLAMLHAMAEAFTPDVCRQLVVEQIAPHVVHGTVDLADAQAIAFQRYAVVRLVPVGAVIDDVLAQHAIGLPADQSR